MPGIKRGCRPRGQIQMSRQGATARFVDGTQSSKELEILDLASDYFLAHGFQGTSINAMARDSGISKESIYRYFSSKKELFEAVIAKELSEYQRRLHTVDFEIQSGPLDLVLRKMAESMLSVVSADRTLGLRRLIFQEATKFPEIGRYYYEIGPRDAYLNLERLFRHHAGRSDLSARKLSRYFGAMLLHHRMLQRQCGVMGPISRNRVREIAKEVTGDFIDAFLD